MSGFFNSLKNLASGAAYAGSSNANYKELEVEDTKMRFSLSPQPGESGFIQWLDAMKMVARLKGGIPHEFRKRLWLTLAERHLEQRRVDWKQAEKICFNEWTNPDDEELGIQIVKDLHRTGCSLFCGTAGRDNQAVLRRVLLGFARWNKSVGYCQGLNVLAALVLQVMDRAESSAVKVMIYLIEGVLPEGYFADNLRGLSVDMAVFRDLLRTRLPKLSKHLESLQIDMKDKATGNSYEPPLTNVFTMQWFLTLFCHCLPQEAVLRVWDLIFLEGDEVLLRTALAIWEGLSDRIMTVTSADEFYSIMGVLTREMLEFTDTDNLILNIVNMGQLHNVTGLREKHRYNITPWARKLSDDEDSDTEEDERLAVAAAMFSMAQRLKKERVPSTMQALQSMASGSDRERLALDITTLKQQYAKLRERQRQAHIILSAACARQSMVPAPTPQAMNHLLVGKNALVSGKSQPLNLSFNAMPTKARTTLNHSQNRRDRQDVTLYWKDTKRIKQKDLFEKNTDTMNHDTVLSHSSQELSEKETSPKRSSIDSDSDSTSTELCDEPDRLSDIDSEEQTSTSDCCPIVAQDDEQYPIAKSSLTSDSAPVCTTNDVKDERISGILGTIQESRRLQVKGENIEHSDLNDLSVAKFIDQIRRLSVENDNNTTISDALNISEKSEIESTDYFLQKSSVEEKSQKYENIDEYEIAFNDAHLKSKYSSLNTEEDRNFEKKLMEENKLLTSSFETEKENSHISEFDGNKIIHCKTDNVIESNINVKESKSEHFSNIPDNSDMTNCNKIIDEKKYSQQYFNSNRSFCEKIEENIESENINKETTFLTTSYVIGHVPIAPRDQNQKLNRIDLDLSCRSIVLESTDVSNYSNILLSKDDKYEGKTQTKLNIDIKISPKTPESNISYSSGETMGPDSKPCSLTVSPRSPISLESQMFGIIKSCSSTSSDSKTLILNSLVESDVTRDSPKSDTKKTSYDKSSPSTPFSTDSLKNKSEISPKLVISSSSESCSPSKIKSSDRSFSSDLQSPVSANSIKYTSNYNKRGHDTFSNSPMDLSAASSPFYPIANPNQKTPSPNSTVKQQSSVTTDKINISPGQKSIKAKETTKLFGCQLKIDTLPKISQTNLNNTLCSDEYIVAKQYSILHEENLMPSEALQNEEAIEKNICDRSDNKSCKKIKENLENDIDDQFFETDELSQLPLEKFDKQPGSYRYKDLTKSLGRSYSSLERRFSDLKITTSTMKRSSDILQDLKHLEAKANEASDNILTKKTSFALEDMKNLEARRQDTFSDSARSFSKTRLNIPNIDIMDDRKTYIIKPKIKIDENSDSILKTISLNRNKDKDDEDDGRESKVGVWTKVKPRNKGNNGRKSSDRALKIIQENSVILHKILTCQAKKRLPDLEEISKEITISPINEEISKIFSPILEKMGLNEHEINEELAKIHLKNLDDISSTNISEFDAKINDELSKLSLIDDTEETENLNVDEIICNDYLNTREALIDRKINEELSKLLANYEVDPSNIDRLERGSSSKKTANIFQTDLEDIAKNKFDYEPPNHSLEIRSNLGDIRKSRIQSDSYPQYSKSVLPYATPKYINIMSPKSDIYKDFTKSDEISAESDISKVLSSTYHDNLSPVRCMQSNLPYTSKLNADTVAECSNTLNGTSFNLSPTKCSYNVYKSYEIRQQVSPEIEPANNYSISSCNRVDIEPTYDYVTEDSAISTNAQNLNMRKIITSKESLEFKVRYDEKARQVNYELSPNQKENIYTLSMDKSLNYYDDLKNESTSTTKYLSITEKCFEKYGNSLPKCSNEIDTSYKGKYNLIPSNEYSYTLNLEQDNSLPVTTSLEQKSDIKSYSHSNQPVNQFLPKSPLSDRYFTTTLNHYTSTISPSIPDELNKSPNHTEYSENMSLHHNIPSSSTSCYRKLSPSQEQVLTTTTEEYIDRIPNPKTYFTPFPIRYTNKKPKELALKLGLYLPKDMDSSQRKS